MKKRLTKYSWPASKIDRDLIHELHVASRETGRPITVLIADAVGTAMNQRLEQAQQPQRIGFVQHESTPRPAA